MYFFYYFPTGLDIRTGRRPVITAFLSVLAVITFVLYRYMPYGQVLNFNNLIFMPLDPRLETSFTHVFLHGGYIHLIGNLIYLVIFGRALEDRFGPGRFFTIFALSAVAGAWAHWLFTTLFAPEFLVYGVIGASGATSGLLGAFLVRLYYARISVAYWVFMPLQGLNRAGRKHVPGILAVAFWLLYQGVYTVMQYGTGAMQVAYGVHIGGFACGGLMAALFGGRTAARAERRLQKARSHFSRANWFAAQGEYINYLEINPGDAEAQEEAARAFLCSDDRKTARDHFTEAVKGYMGSSERGKAEDAFAAAMRSIPGFCLPGKMHLSLAYGMERSLKFNGAMSAYENYIERYPSSGETPFILLRMAGMHEKRFSRRGEAARCYRRIVEEYPDDRWADYARAEIGRFGEAVPA